ncbi:MAG: PTS system mannose/fructose/sorbose family transporter subunit IID, partial [Longimicrobiales bacterium]
MTDPIGRAGAVAILLRSLMIQASWNYRTLLGTGFAFALLPVLRRLYGDGEPLDRAVRRHAALFNSHPYLSPMALGAVARLEADGEPEAVIERFKNAVRGSLGTLGDRLIWAGWRPVCLLAALTLFAAGLDGWVAALVFLGLYNAGHI